MKKREILLALGTLCLSGCAIENLDRDKVDILYSPTMPDMMRKPTQRQRTAIMSGEKPDWSEISTSVPRIIINYNRD
ncbi:hypothetical protein [Erwinia sp.]|uniref:hypothetical protein n=1 Tax=Erwinia citreus TaxID=558 RepID=UPI00289B3E5E|nr:hypothetical protein [Erwinia sp.]